MVFFYNSSFCQRGIFDMKKVLCYLLTTALFVACAAPACAASSYSDLISGVLDDMSSNNESCSGAPQQEANGAYRMVEMLAIIALELDSSGSYSDTISGVLDDMSTNNSYCSGAPQQLANGLYRSVEMAAIVALLGQ